MRKFAVHTLGCKVNHSESMAIKAAMLAASFEYFDDPGADIHIINSCYVTHTAASKTRQLIRQVVKENPSALVLVCGCYSEIAANEIMDIGGVSLVIGQDGKAEIPAIIEDYLHGATPSDFRKVSQIKNFDEVFTEHEDDRTRAFVRIEDGCDRYCTYCIICVARGRVRSRSIESTLREIDHLNKKGYKEIVLTGIHLSSYGKDLETATLIDLIESVAESYPNMRIRLGSLEPGILTHDFVLRAAKIPMLCPQFHLSLQSGCDKTLKAMNRSYTACEYMNSLSLIRNHFDNPAITTDVIAGFPGETEEDFKISYDFCKRAAFAKIHIFPYSKRTGTPAAKMKEQIPENVKKERVHKLMLLEKEFANSYMKSNIGAESELLIEKIENGEAFGHLMNYMPCKVFSPDLKENDVVRVKVENVEGGVLSGFVK